MEGILEKIKANVNDGLDPKELAERREGFGSNEREPPKLRGFCKILWNVMEDTVLRVLLVSSIVSIIINVIVEEEERSIGNEWIH